MTFSHCATQQLTYKRWYIKEGETKIENTPHPPPNYYFHCSNICHLKIMCFHAYFCFALSSSFELRSTFSWNPVSWQHGNTSGLATHSGWKNCECACSNTSKHIPCLSIAWGRGEAYMLLLNAFLLDTILLEQNRTRLDYLLNPLSIVSSPALRVAGLLDSIPAVKQPLVLASRTDSQFRDANFLDRTHTDDTCRKNMQTPLGKSPDPQVLNPCFSLLN